MLHFSRENNRISLYIKKQPIFLKIKCSQPLLCFLSYSAPCSPPPPIPQLQYLPSPASHGISSGQVWWAAVSTLGVVSTWIWAWRRLVTPYGSPRHLSLAPLPPLICDRVVHALIPRRHLPPLSWCRPTAPSAPLPAPSSQCGHWERCMFMDYMFYFVLLLQRCSISLFGCIVMTIRNQLPLLFGLFNPVLATPRKQCVICLT